MSAPVHGVRPRTRVPIEAGPIDGSWAMRCVRTLVALFAHPGAAFGTCPEPIAHARVLGFLATLRLPAWIVLLVVLGVRLLEGPEPEPTVLIPIHRFLEPPLAHVLSVWLVLMIPVGIPLLYFVAGLTAHVGVALTGGAGRSIGASMRAVGLALAPALLAIGILDLPLYLGGIAGRIYTGVFGVVTGLFLVQVGIGLARTHRLALARGLLVALVPTVVLYGATLARASLVLPDMPGLLPPAEGRYYVP